jgi:hypothetical protein
MKKNTLLYPILTFISLVPTVSFAALDGVKGLLTALKDILNLVVPVLLLLSVIYFFWGVGQFILHDAGNDKTREEGKKKILWGIVALFVFVSIWGILGWIGDVIGIPISSSQTTTSSNSNEPPPCDQGGILGDGNPCISQ